MNKKLRALLWPLVKIRRWRENYLRKTNPEKLYSLWHKRATGVYLNIDNPQTLDDKIAYLSFRTDTSDWSKLADKVRVREYVEECGYGEYLPELYGTWESAKDVDFNKLPSAFVIKTNNASATNILVRDKSKINEDAVRNQLDEWLKIDYGYLVCEPHYSRIKPQILAEEFLGHFGCNLLIDYKLYLINGVPRFVQVMSNRKENSHNFSVNIMDMDWIPHPEYCSNHHPQSDKIEKPRSLDKMVEIAKRLSKNYPFVRVDFYEVNDKPIFGEMTFTPGFSSMNVEFQNKVGKELKI